MLFMQFIAEGKTDILAEILNVNGQLYNGLTPLSFATTRGRPETCQLLKDHRADTSSVFPESKKGTRDARGR